MIKIIHIELYRCSIIFLVESTKEEWEEFFKKEKKKETLTERDNLDVLEMFEENHTLGFVIPTESWDYICRISNVHNLGLAAHEIFHAANLILQKRGYVPDEIGEPVAYLIEYITNQYYLAIEGYE